MDSNHRPDGYEPPELPLLYPALYCKNRYLQIPILLKDLPWYDVLMLIVVSTVAEETGFEPAKLLHPIVFKTT